MSPLSDSNGIVISDPNLPDAPIIYVNPAFERMTGYTFEESVGRNCRFLQGEDRDQLALGELRVALREGRECRVVVRNYKKDGTLFWNELSVLPVFDEEGRLIRFVGVQSDITGRKQNEDVQRFLAEASEVLTFSLDYHTTLRSVARLVVPQLADWCAVDMVEENGDIRRLAVVHEDPEKVALAQRAARTLPAGPGRRIRTTRGPPHGSSADDERDTGLPARRGGPGRRAPGAAARARSQVLHSRAAGGAG